MATPSSGTVFTPQRLLLLFCCINMLVYLDRGVISSNGVNGAANQPGRPGTGIQGDFELSLFQDGVLPAAFMVGLLASSPAFAEASKYANAFRLIGVGLGVWTLAVAGCGLALGFWSLAVCRMLVGVGEASFVALASPFIDDHAPPERKSVWLASFYLCIPVGYALGYIYGGIVGVALGWRPAFLIEALAMLPFVAVCFVVPPINIKGTHDVAAKELAAHHEGFKGKLASFWADMRVLASHPIYVLTVGGTAIYVGVLGAYAYLGPKAGREIFNLASEQADVTFGAVTVLTGVFGTIVGGVMLDRIGSSIRNALLMCAGGMVVGGAMVALSFGAAARLWQFIPLFALGEFAWFATQAPSNAVVLWSVPPGLRPFAVSMSIVLTHLLGDVPSPPLLGAFQGLVKNWRISMGSFTALLLLSAALYMKGAAAAEQQPDYRQAELLADHRLANGGSDGGAVDEEIEAALLREGSSGTVQ